MAENAKRMTKGQATEVTEKATTRRRPRTLAEQIAELQEKGQHQLEKLNARYARELDAVAVTMRKINAQRLAVGQEPHFVGDMRFELTDSGAWVTKVPAADEPIPSDSPSPADETEGSDSTDSDS